MTSNQRCKSAMAVSVLMMASAATLGCIAFSAEYGAVFVVSVLTGAMGLGIFVFCGTVYAEQAKARKYRAKVQHRVNDVWERMPKRKLRHVVAAIAACDAIIVNCTDDDEDGKSFKPGIERMFQIIATLHLYQYIRTIEKHRYHDPYLLSLYVPPATRMWPVIGTALRNRRSNLLLYMTYLSLFDEAWACYEALEFHAVVGENKQICLMNQASREDALTRVHRGG